jgi:PAS domain S-box-containing protein
MAAEKEALDMPLDALFRLEDQSGLPDELRGLLRNGTPLRETSVTLTGTSGMTRGLLSAWRAEHGTGEPWLCLSATCGDELDAALAELQDLRTMHELILDAAGEGIYGLDCEGRTTFGNAATKEILGWQPREVIGHKAHDLHHHSHPDGSPYPRTECPIYAALKDGEVHRVDDEVFWHSNGTAVPVEYTSTPIRQYGKLQGAVVVFRDISERREMEHQRETAYEEIKQLKEQLELERDYLREEIKVSSDFGEIIGGSLALKRTLAQIEAVAATPASVLVLGESGVGKEMIARAIHEKSDRAEKPLVKVNCASIPKDLFESEFFGVLPPERLPNPRSAVAGTSRGRRSACAALPRAHLRGAGP